MYQRLTASLRAQDSQLIWASRARAVRSWAEPLPCMIEGADLGLEALVVLRISRCHPEDDITIGLEPGHCQKASPEICGMPK